MLLGIILLSISAVGIYSIYKKVDEILSKFLREMESDDWLIVASDHGHNTVKAAIYVDNLLKKVFGRNSNNLKRRILNVLIRLAWRYTPFRRVVQCAKKVFSIEDKEVITSKVSERLIYNSDSWVYIYFCYSRKRPFSQKNKPFGWCGDGRIECTCWLFTQLRQELT